MYYIYFMTTEIKGKILFLHLERIIFLIQMLNKLMIIPPSKMEYINKLYRNTDFVVQYIHKY